MKTNLLILLAGIGVGGLIVGLFFSRTNPEPIKISSNPAASGRLAGKNASAPDPMRQAPVRPVSASPGRAQPPRPSSNTAALARPQPPPDTANTIPGTVPADFVAITTVAPTTSRLPRGNSPAGPVTQAASGQSTFASSSAPFSGSGANPGRPVSGQAASGGMVEQISAPSGAAIPAVMANGAVEAPAGDTSASSDAATRAADRISEEFLSNVNAVPLDSPQESTAWNDAAYQADEQFRALYGSDAFLQRSRQASKETLAAEAAR